LRSQDERARPRAEQLQLFAALGHFLDLLRVCLKSAVFRVPAEKELCILSF
jgi:hypothetical protein